MVQHGKCDLCRSRKIKCDEGTPSCHACSKGGRPCSYSFKVSRKLGSSSLGETNGDDVRDVPTLRLRSTKQAKQGHGVFQIFANRVQVPSPTLFSTETTKLADRWLKVLELVPKGWYTIWLPLRLGTDRALDAAAFHVFNCLRSFLSQDPRDIQVSHKSASKAFRALRSSLVSSSDRIPDSAFIAVLLLLNTGYLQGGPAQGYLSHALGLSRMLRTRWKDQNNQWTLIEHTTYLSIFIEEVGHAVLTGTESEQDDPMLRQKLRTFTSTITGRPRSVFYFTELVNGLFQFPRLLVKIRLLKDRPNDQELLREALGLADGIYNLSWSTEIWTWLSQNCTTKETGSNPLGLTNEYDEQFTFATAVFFCHSRMLICGAIQRMFNQIESPLLDGHFIRTLVDDEDRKAAEYITMSLEHALEPRPGPPFSALNIYTPLAMSHGAWGRLMTRSDKIGDEETSLHALSMRVFVYDKLRHICGLWHFQAPREELYDESVRVYEGGPPAPECINGDKLPRNDREISSDRS